jgi:hypothetical protein
MILKLLLVLFVLLSTLGPVLGYAFYRAWKLVELKRCTEEIYGEKENKQS